MRARMKLKGDCYCLVATTRVGPLYCYAVSVISFDPTTRYNTITNHVERILIEVEAGTDEIDIRQVAICIVHASLEG